MAYTDGMENDPGSAGAPDPDPQPPAPRPAEPGEAEDEGVDRGRLMESLDMFITDEPPAPATPPARTPVPAPIAPSPPTAVFEEGGPPAPAPAPVAPAPAPRAAPAGGISQGVRQARHLWRFLRLPGLRSPEADQAFRALLLLCTLTIGLIWLLVAYLTPHPVAYFFTIAFLAGPAMLAFHRGGNQTTKRT